jgi:hypothetical protein
LINKGASGSVAGTAPASVTVNGDGIAPGTVASLQITNSQLVLHVALPAPASLKYQSKQSGNWNDFNTWQVDAGSGFVNAVATQTPTSANDTITIQSTHVVTVTASVNADQLTVNTGGLLLVNNGVTFTIDDGAGTDLTIDAPAGLVGTAGNVTNNGQTQVNGTLRIDDGGFPGGGTGTYAYDQTTGALAFNNSTGPYGVNNNSYWPTVNGPQNVSVASGGIQMNVARTVGLTFITSGGVNGAGNLTCNGLFNIFAGGFVSGSPTYGSASTLQYSTGGTYGRAGEWLPNVTSGAGYPANVQLSANTTLDLANGSTTQPFQMSGSLTIDSGSKLQFGSSNPITQLTQPLTVLGNVNVNGALSLSTQPGGDINVGGNWTRAATGTFTPNGRTVTFNGSVNQTVSVTGGGTETFNYLVVNKTSGSAQPNNSGGALTDIVVNATTGDALQLLGSSAFNLNGRTLTMSGNGGNVLVSGGARNVTSTGGVGNFTFSGSKTVASASGGTLSFSGSVKVNLSASVNFGGVSTVSGTLNILPGGAVNTNPPTYASGSILNYDSGGPYDASIEFPSTGVQSVSLASTTQLNLDGDKIIAASFNANSKSVGSTGPTPFSLSAATILATTGTLNLNNVTTSTSFNVSGVGTANVNVAGNWNVAGFSAGTSTVNFNGAGAQSIQTASAFNNLTASNDITLGANTTVNGVLALGAKKITTGANTLSLGTAATATRTNGYIVGTEQKAINGGSFTFDVGTANGYTPVDANSTTGTGSLFVKPTQAKQPNVAGANALARYWTLNGSGITTNLTFHYLAGDVNGTEANYKIFKYSGGAFTPFSPINLDTTNHTATLNGVNSFSDWTLAESASVFGQLQFSATNYDDNEGNSGNHNAVVTVQRAGGGTSGAISVHYATSAGTATNGTDYDDTSGTLDWNDGDAADKTFNVVVRGDNTFEPDEIVNLTLSAPTGGAGLGSPSTATLTIKNDDAANTNPTISDITDQTITQDTSTGALTFTVGDAETDAASLNVSGTSDNQTLVPDTNITFGGSGASRTVTVAPAAGQTGTATITVTVDDGQGGTASDTFLLTVNADVCTTAPNGMVGWWPWQGDGNDVQGTNNATLVGGPVFGAGKVKQALQLDGSTQAAIAPASATLDVGAGNGMTVDVWINPTDVSVPRPIIEWNSGVNSGLDQGIGAHLWMAVVQDGGGAGSLYTNLRTANDDQHVMSTGPGVITANQWQHVAMTYDKTANNGTVTIYVNGSVARQLTNFGVFTPQTTYPLNFGLRAAQGASHFAGAQDEAEVFNRALSASEIANIYNARSAGKCHTSTLQFSSATYSANEGDGHAVITVTRTGAHDTSSTVDYATSDGTAMAGSDYTATSNTLTFAAGEVSKTFDVPVNDDNVFEGNETLNLALSAPNGAGVALGGQTTAVLTINDNDSQPGLSIDDVAADEGDGGTTCFKFTVLLSNPSTQTVTVDYSTADGTATDASGDYQSASSSVSFTPGETSKQLTINVNGDTLFEPNETFFVNLSNASGATITDSQGQGTIQNDDAAPSFSINDVFVSEPQSGTSNATFTVTLSSPSQAPVSVQYATADGTALAPADYDSTSGTLTFASGETTQTISVPIHADALTEGKETFTVNLSNASPSLTISDDTGQATIVDPVLNGQVIISEFRFHGAEGPQDEFVELYNNTNTDITVATDDGTPGWMLAAIIPPGTSIAYIDLLATIPNGTVIPARAHLLLADAPSAPEAHGYSLNVAPSLTYDCDIDDGAGVALFRTAEPTSFNTGTRLDAAGFSNLQTPLADLFREGTGLTSPGPNDGEYSFVRRLSTGLPKDTNDNASDFVFVSTDGGVYGTVPSTLGAPGPENRTSTINRGATIKSTLIDPNASASSPPNRVRNSTSDDANNSHFGTLVLRRKFTNRTGTNITRLRFRIVDVTTRAAGAEPATGTADVRVRTSSSSSVPISGGGTASISGLTLETPPAQGLGGGLNSTLAAGAITLNTPLAPTNSINVEFLLGLQQTGSFRFFVIVEAVLDSDPVNPSAAPAKHSTDKSSPTKSADKNAPLTVKMN